jgi:diketogulonate reductase-like aldo/keto reductase
VGALCYRAGVAAARTRDVRGFAVPAFFYGTAWKEERTEQLTSAALAAGFTAIDTANQRRHYFEAGVGEAVARALAGRQRGELFLQTKYTYARGQDHRLPYDPRAPFAEQVAQSFASSLEHLHTDYLDSYVLHGPSGGYGISAADQEVWRAMEALAAGGKTRLLGASNVSLEQLALLHRFAAIKPAFVQNRCFARMGWDAEVRAFCRDHDIAYQGFSLLTANVPVVGGPVVGRIAERLGRTRAQVVFRFALQVGMIPLTGTSDSEHMKEDLAAFELELEADDVDAIERAG